MHRTLLIFSFFFFNDTATTEIYTLSLHDALPISNTQKQYIYISIISFNPIRAWYYKISNEPHRSSNHTFSKCNIHKIRSEEHTSELQSPDHLVCRLLLEKKKTTTTTNTHHNTIMT